MKNILLTGASGVLGTELISQFLKNEDTVKLHIISSRTEYLMALFGEDSCLQYYSLDEWQNKINFQTIDIVIHGAFARTENGKEIADSISFTENLFSAVAINPLVGVINISSRSVYGQNETFPWNEQSLLIPENKYALGKVANEELTNLLGHITGIKITNIRLAGLIGKNMDARIIARFVKGAIEERKIKVVGGEQHFSLLDTRDAASAIIELTSLPIGKWKQTYNLGSTEQHTLLELAEMVTEIGEGYLNEKIQLEHEKSDIRLLDEMDSSALYNQLNWRPEYSMKDTIRFLFEYYLKK